MARQIVTETTTEDAPAAKPAVAGRTDYRSGNLVYLVLGVLELLLLFRFVFLLLGANAGSGFVSFIYSLSNVFVAPFYGIFGQVNTSAATFDPATLVAMAVYAIAGWIVVRLIAAASNRPVDTM